MRHQANQRFWRCYHQLPEDIRRLADECYELLRQNPRHPSLHFKKIGRFWSARVGLHYRALAVEGNADHRLVLDWTARGVQPASRPALAR